MKNTIPHFILILLICLGFSTLSSAQQRFKAGLVFGFNASQLDGDLSQGFSKWGVNFGARGVVILSPKIEISTEILFSQRGSRFGRAGGRTSSKNQRIDLTYMEVPILFNILMKPVGKKKDRYFKNQLSTGVSIGRMINSAIEETGGDNVIFSEAVEFFNKTDLSYLLGFTHFASRHLGLGMRMTISVNKIFDANETPLPNPENELVLLRSYFFSGRLVYMF